MILNRPAVKAAFADLDDLDSQVTTAVVDRKIGAEQGRAIVTKPARTSNRKVVVVIVVLLVSLMCLPVLIVGGVGLGLVAYRKHSHVVTQEPAKVGPNSVAVLRVVSIGDPDNRLHFFPHAHITETFCDGLTDVIRRQFSQSSTAPLVVPKSTNYKYVVTEQDALSAGRALNVRAVLMGTLHCEDSEGKVVPQDLAGSARLVLRIKLIDVSTGSLLWDAVLKDDTPMNAEERHIYQEKMANQVAESAQRKLTGQWP